MTILINPQFSIRQCPCCGANDVSDQSVATTKSAETETFDNLRPYWNGFHKDKIIFTYYRCSKCGLLYAPYYFSKEQLEALYEQMPANMDVIPSQLLSETQYGYFNTLQKYSTLTGSYLEIGPDAGLFTKYCVQNGKFNYFWLIEPNRFILNELTAVVDSKGFSIIHQMDDYSSIPDASLSTVVMIHVLDHLLDPRITLKALRNKLQVDSRILIVTHDERSLLSSLLKIKWPPYCLQHPQLYNTETITNLLNECGFKVVKINKSWNSFPFSFLLSNILAVFGIYIKTWPAFLGFKLSLPLGNIITIAKPDNGYSNV